MRFYNLPISYRGSFYYFNRLLGILFYTNYYIEKNHTEVMPNIVLRNYQLVLNPYLLDVNDTFINFQDVPFLAKIYAKLLVFISRYSFFTACIFTKIPFCKFINSKQSLAIFAKIYPCPIQQQILCLPRTLFVIATSKSFKQNGTAFVGVFLPSKKMHAWIIESGCNPDSFDEIWLSYQPVVAITK